PVTNARLPVRNICRSMRIALFKVQARLAAPVQPFLRSSSGGFMRLNPFNPNNINVRRGGGGGFPGGGGGQLGCGAIVVALIGALVFGIDPGQMLGSMEGVQQGAPGQQPASGESAADICDDNAYATEACNALASLNDTWAPIFEQAGVEFRQ